MGRSIRVGINGFGRMGRLALRAGWESEGLEFVHINEIAGDVGSAAHLLAFDSVHGRWRENDIGPTDDSLHIAGSEITYSSHAKPGDIPWDELGVELVIEATGAFRSRESLAGHFDRGASKVLVAAPVKTDALNIVYGVNHDEYDQSVDGIVTAASCTTNCLAPIVKVVHEGIGIRHGSITTLHDLTNTQVVVDAQHKDLRRARSAGTSLIPTSTGSATAIGMIFPELVGRLDGLAIRVPLLNSSITDCCFEVERATSVDEINGLLENASSESLSGILGYETRPLVSVDFKDDPRSGVVDATSTRTIDGTQVKILAFYDNEWGYANRMIDIAKMIGPSSTAE
ncbi:MAG: ArsJ-associated glyceraldehyde-3-phosphate dehydrogenase [Solirubrobacterales bacterium]|nr:ArsJ-associated glyceraldehyde-3-phosphate dehydrogenase [Solirubrobacterales bacterium]OJU94971.1 MAG: type I glyceraldehyde-3-phosphate dehydrogenase [Solirubrobacterales bacterium 67-14]